MNWCLYIHFLLFIGFAHTQASAQNALAFGVTPSAVLDATIPSTGANEVWIFFPNTSADSIKLTWRRIQVTKPTQWEIDLCDYGECVSGVPASGIMNMLGAGDSAYLKLIVQPKGHEAEAILDFRVALQNDQTQYRDVQFRVKTAGLSDAQTFENQAFAHVFPNPVQDLLTVTLQSDFSGLVQLLDVHGRLVEQQVAAPAQQVYFFDMRLRQIGLYHIHLSNRFGAQAVKVVRVP